MRTSVQLAWLRPALSSALACALLVLAGPAEALDVVVSSQAIAPDLEAEQTVRLDVWLDLGPEEPAPDLAAFQVVVTLSRQMAGGGLNPPALLPSAMHPALITSNFTPDFAGSDGPQRVSAAAFVDTGSTAVIDGAGLMQVELLVPAGTTGIYGLHVELDPIQGTALADGLGDPVSFGTVDGTLRIAQVLPALSLPSQLLLGLLLGLSALRLVPPRASASRGRSNAGPTFRPGL